jgi:proline iminopeptidase
MQTETSYKAFDEGYVTVNGYKLYFKSFGREEMGTILTVHGGPGLTHDYMLSIADLAKYGYRVVFYDQLGCGKSDVPKNIALFTIDRAVEDLEGFRDAMNLGKVHMLGSSYGGLLAIAFALKYQKYLKSLITTGGIDDMELTISEMMRMKSELPKESLATMAKYEEAGDYTNPEFARVLDPFYKTYFCRLDPWPKELLYSMEHVSPEVYKTMNGPNEFTIIGNIRHWKVSQEQLHAIRVPTLVTCGKYDEVSPKVAKSIHRGIKGSKFVMFPNSSHLAMWEERERYIQVVSKFLESVGKKRPSSRNIKG